MELKLSEYKTIEGFNQVASALFQENHLKVESQEDFERLFPDQIKDIHTFNGFFNEMKPLNNERIFVEKIKNFDKNLPICVAGDYDSDGIMATSIMCHGLSSLGYNVHFLIPNRLSDGYGMQNEILVKDLENNKTELFITVDNGITAVDTVKILKEKGSSVIITDHHLPDPEQVPDTDIIDPKYNGDEYSDICGAYVALKLIYALYKEVAPDKMNVIETLVPLAGIATITDMMPVLGENRILINLTLDLINNCKYNNDKNSPLYKIINAFGGKNFLSSDSAVATEELISFSIGPAINAISRVKGDVNDAVQKITECLSRPWSYIPSYVQNNYMRQKMTKELFSDFQLDTNYKLSSVFVYDKNIYSFPIKGILGLLANKVTNKHNIVSLVGYLKDDGFYEFSGRSTRTYSLHDGIDRIKAKFPELELGGGGHAQAMGVRLNGSNPENLKIFKDALEADIAENSIPYNPTIFEWEPDMEDDIISTMEALQPYGTGFTKPIFKYSGIFLEYDNEEKIATISDYKFRMFISQNEIDELIGNDIDILFTVAFSNNEGPMFNVINE